MPVTAFKENSPHPVKTNLQLLQMLQQVWPLVIGVSVEVPQSHTRDDSSSEAFHVPASQWVANKPATLGCEPGHLLAPFLLDRHGKCLLSLVAP